MVAKGLQYAPSKGIPEFLSEIKTLRHNYHGISNLEDQIDVCVSVGSQNGLEMLLSSLINPLDGILLDEPCYPGTKAILGPLGANMIGVETDSDGMNLKDLIKKINFAKEKNITLKVRFYSYIGNGQIVQGSVTPMWAPNFGQNTRVHIQSGVRYSACIPFHLFLKHNSGLASWL